MLHKKGTNTGLWDEMRNKLGRITLINPKFKEVYKD